MRVSSQVRRAITRRRVGWRSVEIGDETIEQLNSKQAASRGARFRYSVLSALSETRDLVSTSSLPRRRGTPAAGKRMYAASSEIPALQSPVLGRVRGAILPAIRQ